MMTVMMLMMMLVCDRYLPITHANRKHVLLECSAKPRLLSVTCDGKNNVHITLL